MEVWARGNFNNRTRIANTYPLNGSHRGKLSIDGADIEKGAQWWRNAGTQDWGGKMRKKSRGTNNIQRVVKFARTSIVSGKKKRPTESFLELRFPKKEKRACCRTRIRIQKKPIRTQTQAPFRAKKSAKHGDRRNRRTLVESH